MNDPAQLRVSNQELATVREAMRELGRLLDQLDEGELEKDRADPTQPDARGADHRRALQRART